MVSSKMVSWPQPIAQLENSYLSSVQSLSCIWLFVTPGTAARQASLSITNSVVHSNSCPLSHWCHPTISSSVVVPFSSRLQSFPASGFFPMSLLFSSGGQSIEVSASTSVLPMNIQDWSPLGWTVGSPRSPRDSQESSPTPQFKSTNSLVLSFLYSPSLTSIHDHWKNHSLTRWTFDGKVMSLLFNILSWLVIIFLPSSKYLLISWLQSPSVVILEPPKIKPDAVSTVSPSICHEVIGPDVMILVFWMLSFMPTFSLSSFTFIKRLFEFFIFCHKGGVICISEVIDISPSNLDSSCASSSPAFLMMYSEYKLNKQGDNIQPWYTPWYTPFPIWNQSVVPCPVLTVASWPTYRVLKRQVRWSGIPISFRIFLSLLWPT